MINNSQIFEVPNINAKDADVKKLVFKVSDIFLKKDNSLKLDEYICVCSGGTTSSCAKNNFMTLDLRKNYSHINFDLEKKIVTIGGGVGMKSLLVELEKFGRFFPTGLSNLPGVGFVLTGGISPLSRRYGLAIDNMEFIKGYLGNGNQFSINKEEIKGEEEIKLWEGIKGGAPFFSIITEIGLKTFKSFPISIFEGFVNTNELSDLIKLAEKFPTNTSLQWMFAEKIYIYILCELKTSADKLFCRDLQVSLNRFKSLRNNIFSDFSKVRFFPSELNLFELNEENHSEVISLLGRNSENNNFRLIKTLSEIMKNRPNSSCYVACQQLGGKTEVEHQWGSYFVHRDSTWKPWIYTSWKKNDLKEKKLAYEWLTESWTKLKEFYPKIHLAQLHNHLNFHSEEINLAYGKKLSKLKLLKNFYDPEGNLPPL